MKDCITASGFFSTKTQPGSTTSSSTGSSQQGSTLFNTALRAPSMLQTSEKPQPSSTDQQPRTNSVPRIGNSDLDLGDFRSAQTVAMLGAALLGGSDADVSIDEVQLGDDELLQIEEDFSDSDCEMTMTEDGSPVKVAPQHRHMQDGGLPVDSLLAFDAAPNLLHESLPPDFDELSGVSAFEDSLHTRQELEDSVHTRQEHDDSVHTRQERENSVHTSCERVDGEGEVTREDQPRTPTAFQPQLPPEQLSSSDSDVTPGNRDENQGEGQEDGKSDIFFKHTLPLGWNVYLVRFY